MSANQKPPDGSVILFDGVCNLCERSVQFVIRHDPNAKFSYAPLQSEPAQKLLAPGAEVSLDSFVLVAGGRVLLRSDAWLEICRQLQGWPRWLAVFKLVPRPLRDAVYNFIGRYRYRWFGRKESCMVPTPDIARRFLA